MAKMTEVKLDDFSPKVLEQMEEQVLLGLELIGHEAEKMQRANVRLILDY